MSPLEAFLLALIEAIVQGVAAVIAPLVVQQIQQPSTAQDAYVDTPLEQRIEKTIADPAGAGR